MQDRARRTEIGKMLIDVAKYVFTLIVIGGLFSERLNIGAITMGVLLATGIATIGFLAIPPEE